MTTNSNITSIDESITVDFAQFRNMFREILAEKGIEDKSESDNLNSLFEPAYPGHDPASWGSREYELAIVPFDDRKEFSSIFNPEFSGWQHARAEHLVEAAEHLSDSGCFYAWGDANLLYKASALRTHTSKKISAESIKLDGIYSSCYCLLVRAVRPPLRIG